MISASKTTYYIHYNLKILRPEVKKNINNFRNKFCELPLSSFVCRVQGRKTLEIDEKKVSKRIRMRNLTEQKHVSFLHFKSKIKYFVKALSIF